MIQLENKPIVLDRRKAMGLLIYLATNEIGHVQGQYSREFLSAFFWTEYDQTRAFAYLRRTLWELNQTIGGQWLISQKGTLSISHTADLELDITHFRGLLLAAGQQSTTALRIPLFVDAAKLYRNHFLTGFSLKDSPDFNRWAFSQSETLQAELAAALNRLVQDYCALNQPESAIPHARRLISLDPLNESAHRQLMEVYDLAGQNTAALKQYLTCEKILRKELQLDPQPETRDLYKKIRRTEKKHVQIQKHPEAIESNHNLPSPLTSFIGRAEQREEIIRLLQKNRLVTLIGAGGIGKTRLSLEVGEKLRSLYSDGVWLITLDSLSDAELIPHTIASVFNIREGSNADILEKLLFALQTKSMLLILDNCEHLLPACAHVSETILKKCPGQKILATSREILGAVGELVYTVPSLSLPEDRNSGTDHPNQDESIQLFEERAALTTPAFAVTADNSFAVNNICKRLDGIPLAIELAAARVDILQPNEILEQLNHCFDLLVSNSRTALPRHQTMRASMDWSWGLLAEEERLFMSQLSVFAGGWTLGAAKTICAGDVLNLTSALVKKSLIVVKQETGRETRYHFHEIVRQYAHEKLSETGTEQDIRTRHLGYFLSLAQQAETALTGHSQTEWTVRLEAESDNFRAALDWAARGNVEAGLYLSARLHNFKVNFDLRESARWLNEFLEKREASSFPSARAGALYAYGNILILTQQFHQARTFIEEGLTLDRSQNNKHGEVDGLLSLALVMANFGDIKKEKEFAQEALRVARALGDTSRIIEALGFLGREHLDYPTGQVYLREAIALARTIGDLNNLARFLGHLGRIEMLNGDFEAAQKSLEEAISLSRQLNRKNILFSVWDAYGRMSALLGNYEQAQTALQECVVYAHKTGERMAELWFSAHLGYVTLRQGDAAETRDLFTKCVKEFWKDNVEIGVVFAVEGMAGLLIVADKQDDAARLIGWTDTTREKIADKRPPLEQAAIDRMIAACLRKMGEVAFADAYEEGQMMTLDQAVRFALQEG